MSDSGAAGNNRRTPQQEAERQNRLKRRRQSDAVVEAPPPVAAAASSKSQAPPTSDFTELFLKFLPNDTSEEEIASIFGALGALAGPPVLQRDFATMKPRGIGWVTYEAPGDARRAQETLNGLALRGRHIDVSVATVRRERPHMELKGTQQAPGTHSPAMLAEIVDLLVSPDPRGVYVDGTFGRGGHTRGLLAALAPKGALHAFDMDHEAVAVGEALAAEDARFSIHRGKFGRMAATLKDLRGGVAGVLLDLGISSPQLDDPTRGMRPEQSGPLDCRFDVTRGMPAWQYLETASREDICAVLARYGDGQDAASAARIADAVVLTRETEGGVVPRSTSDMARLVAAARCGGDYQPMHAAKLTFQALRMHLNDERGQLRKGLAASFKLLKPGGRIAIITWKHSECAIVMDFLREHELAGKAFPLRHWWERDAGNPPLEVGFGLRRGDAVRAGAEELRTNARARSAVLHVLYKEKGVRVSTVQEAVYGKLGWEPLNPLTHAIAHSS